MLFSMITDTVLTWLYMTACGGGGPDSGATGAVITVVQSLRFLITYNRSYVSVLLLLLGRLR